MSMDVTLRDTGLAEWNQALTALLDISEQQWWLQARNRLGQTAEAHGAASELRCAVRGETSFVLTVQAGFADPTAPLQGSIGLEGTDAPTSTSFVADP